MDALHDDDDRARALVVKTGQQRIREPLIGSDRFASDKASSGLSGSSMTMVSPPRPVSVPPTDVARRNPRAVSSISVSVFLNGPIRAFGKANDRHRICPRQHHRSVNSISVINFIAVLAAFGLDTRTN
jgi:hypothetical protein